MTRVLRSGVPLGRYGAVGLEQAGNQPGYAEGGVGKEPDTNSLSGAANSELYKTPLTLSDESSFLNVPSRALFSGGR